jgi:dipeptidyl aminopeptidase/acylaminoacyl peptidase
MHLAQPLRLPLLVSAVVFGCFLWSVRPAGAEVVTGTLYFTTFYTPADGYGPSDNRLHSVTFNYNSAGNNLSFGAPTTITTNHAIGADGIIFAPDGKTLLIGGQDRDIYHVDPTNGHVLNTLGTGGVDVYHLALSPNGNTVYGGGSEGNSPGLAVVPTNPYGNGVTEAISGSNSTITGIAFDSSGQAFYTASSATGDGNFGTISNLNTSPVTHSLIAGLTAAHGITYDPFTKDFILVGGNEIAQVDTTGHVISERFFSGYVDSFDQASVDGQGHLFVANNDGNMLFVDYSASGLIGASSNFTAKHFLATYLDDVAPLVGPGGGGLGTPEPSSFALLSFGLAAMTGYGWRRRKT